MENRYAVYRLLSHFHEEVISTIKLHDDRPIRLVQLSSMIGIVSIRLSSSVEDDPVVQFQGSIRSRSVRIFSPVLPRNHDDSLQFRKNVYDFLRYLIVENGAEPMFSMIGDRHIEYR